MTPEEVSGQISLYELPISDAKVELEGTVGHTDHINKFRNIFSAKIRNVYVELIDYKYFHGPHNDGEVDDRFTGREKPLSRLYQILTSYQSPSGAYLITGYRGVGKSTLVSRVLNEITFQRTSRERISRLYRIFLFLLLISLMGTGIEKLENSSFGTIAIMATGLLSITGLIYLLTTDPQFPDLIESPSQKFSSKRRLQSSIWRLVGSLTPRPLRRYKIKARTASQTNSLSQPQSRTLPLSLLSMPPIVLAPELEQFKEWCEDYINQMFDSPNPQPVSTSWPKDPLFQKQCLVDISEDLKNDFLNERLLRETRSSIKRSLTLGRIPIPRERFRFLVQDTVVAGLLGIIVVGFSMFLDAHRFLQILTIALVSLALYGLWLFYSSRKEGSASPAATLTEYFLKNLKDYFQYRNRVVIDVNLGHESLNEIEILRTISGNLHSKYLEFASSIRSGLPWRAVIPILFTILLAAAYHISVVNQASNALKRDLHFMCFFPSQGSFLLEGRDAYFKALGPMTSLSSKSIEAHLSSATKKKHIWHDVKEALGHEPFDHPFDPPILYPGYQPTSTFLNGTVKLFSRITIYLDFVTQHVYRNIVSIFPYQQWEMSDVIAFPGTDDVPFRLVPSTIDYFFVALLAILWFGLRSIIRLPSLGLISHWKILKRLRDLNERIEAQITTEQGAIPLQANSLLTLSFGSKTSRTSRNLSARDIEINLMEIMKLIDGMPRLTMRPEFIFVFDELDKIQYGKAGEVDGNQPEFRGREFSSVEIERERQHQILTLVANLKHFFTAAPAKFIFIAGREMFDASLADVADRQFFMGSVFNEVINVPSFHTDDSGGRRADITSLPEEYLCRLILPKELWTLGLSLKIYRHYLESHAAICGPNSSRAASVEKIIYQLHNFIIYLTHRSNGAPKKLLRTLERFVVTLDGLDLEGDSYLLAGRSTKSRYLEFSYFDQYTFDLVAYLGSPLILSLNREISDYGDKILVSSSFLLDNIYKFHGRGFSWRNLEVLPEIVDINQAPYLRDVVARIMNFLSRSDIVDISAGLFDFKFSRLVSEELAFVSKISEFEAAAFNFTLDESLALKRHFSRKLERLHILYKDYPNASDNHIINSLIFLRMILGDLHYYDNQLDNAVVEYMEAVQTLRSVDIKKLRVDTVVLMTRNLLKLGLALERKRSYESALVAYGQVAAIVSQLAETFQAGELDEREPTTPRNHLGKLALDSIGLLYQATLARFQLIEKLVPGGIQNSDLSSLDRELQRTLQEIVRLRRPLLDHELSQRLADLLFFKNGPRPDANDQIYCYRSDSICNKNLHRDKLIQLGRSLPCAACARYSTSLLNLCKSYDIAHRDLRSIWASALSKNVGNCTSATWTAFCCSLSNLGDTFLSCAHNSKFNRLQQARILSIIKNPFAPVQADDIHHFLNIDMSKLSKLDEALICFGIAAFCFRRIGDSRGCAKEITKLLWVLRTIAHDEAMSDRSNPLPEGQSGVNFKHSLKDIANGLVNIAIEENFRCHEGTHRIEIEKFKEILEMTDRPRQFERMVNLGRLSINSSLIEALVLVMEIELEFVDPDQVAAIDLINSPVAMFNCVYARIHALRYRSLLHIHNLEALGLVGTGSEMGLDHQEWIDTASTSETLTIFWKQLNECIDNKQSWAKAAKIFGNGSIESRMDYEVCLEFILTDAIFCCHEIIRFLAIYGSSYMASHSMRASAHRTLARWCRRFLAYMRFKRENLSRSNAVAWGTSSNEVSLANRHLQKLLGDLLDPADIVGLHPNYQSELARIHYLAAIEVHSEGKAYREIIDNMYFLEEGFGDHLDHFCAAMERFLINSGRISSGLNVSTQALATTGVYNSENFRQGGSARSQSQPRS